MPEYKVTGAWQGNTAGGCFNLPSWRYNPQVFLTIPTTATVYFKLAQDIKTHHCIGFYVAHSKKVGVRQLGLKTTDIVGKIGFEDSKEVTLSLNLEPGDYVVIPCTFYPGEEGKFQITIRSDQELKLSELSPTAEWSYVTQKGEWKGKTAGGCLEHSTFHNNPQFVLKADEPTTAVILLAQTTKRFEEFDDIGFYVFETKTVKNKLTNLTHKDIITQGEFSRATEATIEFEMQPRKVYAIVPCTFEPGKESVFELTVFSTKEVKMHELKSGGEAAQVAK